MKTERLVSAGCVVYRREDGATRVVLIARRDKTIWCLPKGKIENGEPLERTAEREVKEETGLEGRIEKKLGEITYWFTDPRPLRGRKGARYFKRVHFYLMSYIKGSTANHDDEVDEAKWFPIDEALRIMSYPSEREMMKKAKAILSRQKGI